MEKKLLILKYLTINNEFKKNSVKLLGKSWVFVDCAMEYFMYRNDLIYLYVLLQVTWIKWRENKQHCDTAS